MFRAIGRVLHWIWSGLDGLRKVLHLLLLLALFGILWGAFSRPIPLVPDKAALVIRPRGPIVEQLTGDPLERAIAEIVRQQPTQTLLRDVVDAIEAAADDDRISSLYLDVGGLERGGLAKLQEIAAAIDGFRATGKPVIAYGGYYEQGQYYLAAHADEIYLDPMGAVFVDGFANYGTFVKDALDKLSVDVNIFRVGQYKSAVETFSRNDMSPAEREESLVWLNTVWGTYKADVAKAREFDPAVLQAYADQAPDALRRAGGDLAKMALDARLVTSLKGRFEVEQRLAQITGPDEDAHSFVGVDLDSYLANVDSQQALSSGSRRKIGLIVASGEIVPGEQPPGMVGSDTLAAQLRDALFDESREGRGAEDRQPRRQRLRERGDSPPGAGAARGGQARRGFDEQPRRFGRLLHRDGCGSHRREPRHAHRLDRHLRHVPDHSSARSNGSACTPTASARRRCPASSASTGRWATRRRTCCSRPSSADTTISSAAWPRRASGRSKPSTRWRRAGCGPVPTRSASVSWTSSVEPGPPSRLRQSSRSSATITTSSTSMPRPVLAMRSGCVSAWPLRASSHPCCHREPSRRFLRCCRHCLRRRSASRG